MDAATPSRPHLVPSRSLARRLGVSQALIRRETERGTLPHVCDGRRVLYDVDQARAALLRMAARAAEGEGAASE